MAAWLMTQLSPDILLFGTGDLRQMLDLPPVQPSTSGALRLVEDDHRRRRPAGGGTGRPVLLQRHARLADPACCCCSPCWSRRRACAC
jgi:hypothetical protein